MLAYHGYTLILVVTGRMVADAIGRDIVTKALRSNKNLRDALKSFFSLIAADVQSPETAGEHIMFETGGRFAHGVWFIESDAAEMARSEAIALLTRIMGAMSSDEDENDALLWQIAAECSQPSTAMSVDQAIEKVFDELEKNIVELRTFINQNDTIRFRRSVIDLRIGPVRSVKTAILEAELPVEKLGSEFLNFTYTPLHNDSRVSDTRIKPDLLWEVGLTASIKNIREEATWMINVALGIIRMAEIQQPFHHPLFSDIPEANPFGKPPNGTCGIVLCEGSGHFLSNMVDIIQIDDGIHAILMSNPCKKYMAVFNATKGSVGARVAQGLGWMTRGRQATDRSERLLYFFTAMESLLTNDDKTAPVTQTIARHASVILSKKPGDRVKVANRIKILYRARSSLIHAGKRNVTRRDADMMQSIVESTYFHVMSNVDPSTKFETLNTALATASYGGPWP